MLFLAFSHLKPPDLHKATGCGKQCSFDLSDLVSWRKLADTF